MEKKAPRLLPLVSWCLFGWASDTFPVLITTFIFSTYFIEHVAPSKITGTYLWANATSIAGVLVAISSPIFGSIADQGGHHRRWLLFFTCCSIISTSLLWFAYPSSAYVTYTLTIFVIAASSLEFTLVFYNSFLPRLAPPRYMGRISGWGWGLGYFGGITALTAVLFIAVIYKPAWLNSASFQQIRIAAPFSALWFAVFGLPLFLFLPNTPKTQLSTLESVRYGLYDLVKTFKMLLKEKNILLFLVARMIYTDGLNTLFAFGGIFAAGTFHFSFTEIILFGISLNVLAGVGAIALAWVDDHLGAKPTIIISLCFLLLFSGSLLFMHNQLWFWVTACLLAIFVGPTQSASRSLMAHLTPKSKSSEFFGFYSMTGRLTAFLAPWLLGLVTIHFHNQRAGMAIILVFFAFGLILLTPVRTSKPQVQIAKSSQSR